MADRAIVLRAMVGSVVHVREDGLCRAATVLDCGIGHGSTVPTLLLLRVRRPSGIVNELGCADSEGWYHSHATAPVVDRPDGSTYRLDAWHFPDDHDPDCRRFDAVESAL